MKTYTNSNNHIYSIKDIKTIKRELGDLPHSVKAKHGKMSKKDYYDIPCAFDIETSSWFEGDDKRACMYIWQFGINGYCIIGRTWDEFKDLISGLQQEFKEHTLIIYIHNLAYEYQWIKNLFKWDKVFCIDDRKPVQLIYRNIEFRCSYMLSQKSLEKVGNDLLKYKVDKLHSLDYKQIRTPLTKLTNEELQYCINDIKVVMSYIQETIEQNGSLVDTPLTSTGYVRKMCKDACFGKGDQRRIYNDFIKDLKLSDEVYSMCRRAFQGGYVHCNCMYSGKTMTNVSSYDFTSSYPTSMVAYPYYPMSTPKKVEVEDEKQFYNYLRYYACLFDIKFYNIRLKEDVAVPPISFHKCIDIEGEILDNGRVIKADSLIVTITEQDFEIYEDFYDWDEIQVGTFYTFVRGHLPKAIISVILDLYEKKTTLKGVEDEKVNYLLSKAALNSVYGMIVTDVSKQADSIDDYNKSYSRFLYYPWGVWVTAISRKALFTGIKECGDDFIYSDTDSIKFINRDNHLDYIEKYNSYIIDRLEQAMDYYKFDRDRIRPKTIYGEEKPMGVWDYEGDYDEFRALRAKAYIGKKKDKYELTLSGVTKKAIEYLKENGDPIAQFKDGLIFPKGKSGKTTHTYIDSETTGKVIDKDGIEYNYHELSSIHIEEADYEIKMIPDFVDIIEGILRKIK